MNIVDVAVTNFMSHAESALELNGERFVTIRGDHGAGKSALAIDAVRYCLFGRGRFDTADEPVRLGATDMSVRVEWISPDGQRYRVIRRRTTKAGGKGSLNFALQRPDGAWTTRDGDSIRETEALIRETIGVDGPTFEAIAFLTQGRITALVDATASGRRDVLVAGLLLDIWPKAAKRAREEARDLEARTAAERDEIVRLEELVSGRGVVDAEIETLTNNQHDTEAFIARFTGERTTLEARIRELDAQLAAAQAIADRAASLERERTSARETWHAARTRIERSTAEVARLEGLLADRGEVDAAAAALPPAKAGLEQLVAGEADERRLQREIADMDRAIRDLEVPHQQAVATWKAQHEAAQAKIVELEAHTRAGGSTCVACGQAIDDVQALEQLTAARQALIAVGERPQEPIAIARARAGKVRLQDRVTALAWDPAALVTQRELVEQLTAVAARADALAAAQASIDRERAAIADGEAEQARISERGRALTDELATLQPQLDAAGSFREEASEAREALAKAAAQLTYLEGERRRIEREIAGAEARLEQLAAQSKRADELRAKVAGDQVAIADMKRLAAAFAEVPLRIIDGSLPAIEAEAQVILDQLDPGARVEIAAQRATVDGKKVVSAIDIAYVDGAGRRDVRMTSGGERVAVSVALSFALRKVVASRNGARLATAALDEPDGLDSTQRRALGIALQQLSHAGDLSRTLLITHSEDLAEGGEAQFQVTKNGRGSVVERIA